MQREVFLDLLTVYQISWNDWLTDWLIDWQINELIFNYNCKKLKQISFFFFFSGGLLESFDGNSRPSMPEMGQGYGAEPFQMNGINGGLFLFFNQLWNRYDGNDDDKEKEEKDEGEDEDKN